MVLGEVKRLSVEFREPLPNRSIFTFTYRNSAGAHFNATDKLPIEPLGSFTVESGSNKSYQMSIFTSKPGTVELGLASTDINITHLEYLHARINVCRQKSLSILQQIVGWAYFLAWTLSFYPQVILNCQRKSVTGLSFDFVVFNVIGFACYSAFNIGLYFVPRIQAQYFARHPLSVIPVAINDLFFGLHGLAMVLVLIVQCLFFERGSQRVSKTCITISCLMLLFVLTSTLLAAADVVNWLTALYLYSYVKLFVTLVKYFPQLILNCRRRSCVGWSLGNFILDFIGGVLSIVQMFIAAYNCVAASRSSYAISELCHVHTTHTIERGIHDRRSVEVSWNVPALREGAVVGYVVDMKDGGKKDFGCPNKVQGPNYCTAVIGDLQPGVNSTGMSQPLHPASAAVKSPFGRMSDGPAGAQLLKTRGREDKQTTA
ncbi:cystinosin [Echinococcus multilocularis]|uniref:Cystinosin n=1 Tax=Echinococcus multilocularis TaxID=6211 RepID=A0A087VZP3_ECHMU|nr:cystinosin [Echinococcus multilocularis]